MLCESVNVDCNGKDEDDDGGESIDETDFYAWNELRLHPSLMKSIYRLGFKEPTPIQKSCIPAAAHQGKVSRVNVSDKVIFCGKAYLWTVLFFQVVIVMFYVTGCYWCCRDWFWKDTCFWFAHLPTASGGKI